LPDGRDIRSRLLEGLAADERAGVEDPVALLVRAAPPAPPPPFELETRTLAAIRTDPGAGEAAGNGRAPEARRVFVPAPRRRRLTVGRPAFAGGLAVALAAGVLLGTMLGGNEGLPGTKEVEATLRAPDGASARATVQKTGIGRVIDFRTDELPILPEGEYYELWFVGPGDRPGRPQRISAGTFHPDGQGRSNVRFTAAVDPAKYPGLAVTAEPGDGNPAPQGPDVLRFRGAPQP
jgi:Anti-sigma-K factor rskA